MAQYTPSEYAAYLTRIYTPRFPRENRPRAITDVTERGEAVLEFILPHPEDGRFSASLQAFPYRETVAYCSLRFGQVEVARRLDPEKAVAAVEEVISDRIVAIVRYKNRAAYENHRIAASGPAEWLYQLPDDGEELERMTEKLKKPATFFEKVSGAYTGVFEIYRWSGREVLER